MRYILSLFGLSAAAATAAPVATPVDLQPDLTRPQILREQAKPKKAKSKKSKALPAEMSSEDILQRPDVLTNALDTALSQQHADNIRFLLPLYRRLPAEQQNPTLVKYAEAMLMQAEGNLSGAQKQYREMLYENPEFAPVRLQLAQTLALDGQQREAAQEVEKVRQTPNLPMQVGVYLNQFDRQLKEEKAWKFDAGLSYLQDSNVGRTPEQRTYGNWQFSEPKSAHGLAYDFSAQKTVPVKGHWAIRVTGSGNGKFYWDAHDYDDLIVRAEAGAVWRNAKQEASFSPFYEKRWYGTEPYSANSGGVLRYSRSLSPNWQLHGAWQSGYKKHDEREYLDGSNHSLSLSLVQRTSPQQAFVYGIDGGIENARDESEAYHRCGLRGTWMRNWGDTQNLNTTISLAAQRRNYRAADLFNIKREDTEYFTRVSASHKKLSWQGFTPRVNWTWSHIHSNHFYYRYDRHRVFLDITKRF